MSASPEAAPAGRGAAGAGPLTDHVRPLGPVPFAERAQARHRGRRPTHRASDQRSKIAAMGETVKSDCAFVPKMAILAAGLIDAGP